MDKKFNDFIKDLSDKSDLRMREMGVIVPTAISADYKVFTKLKLLSDGVPADFFTTTNGKVNMNFNALVSPELIKNVGKSAKLASAMNVSLINGEKDSVIIGNLGFAEDNYKLGKWNPQKMTDVQQNQPPLRIEFALIAPNKSFSTKSQLRVCFMYAGSLEATNWYRNYLLNLAAYLDKFGIRYKIESNL